MLNKKIIAVSIIFFVLLYSASSLKVFTVEETDTISLKTQAQDPDDDQLEYSYSEPLDENGQWQTNYGDAGTYNSSVTVTDGSQSVSEKILIIVTKKQQKPVIESFSPEQTVISLDEGEVLSFEVNASDLNDDPLQYQWMVDGREAVNTAQFSYEPAYDGEGHHSIELIVSDGEDFVKEAWDVDVSDVDLDALFEDIRDISIEETQVASLQLPDFSAYELTYEISDPIGNDNVWQTSFDDSGDYPLTLFVNGNGYERKKNLILSVRNKDRPPIVSVANKKIAYENEEVQFLIEANDPDGDEVRFSADNLPKNAVFEGNTLIWTPDFEEVQKRNAFDYLLDNFRILSKTRNVEIVAASSDSRIEKQIKIVVHDVNQPFVWEPMEEIVIMEGEDIVLEPRYTDPDNDAVSFAYSGYMVTNTKKTSFDDAGRYVVKVRATDGFYTQTQFVDIVIENSNRPPEMKGISQRTVMEGQQLIVKLQASDPDGEEVVFSSDDLPQGSSIEGNEFVWVPSFEVTDSQAEITIPLSASDEISRTEGQIQVKVLQVNRAPKIEESSNTQVAFVGETVPFEVKAVDEDGDALTYTWDFGLFESYAGDSAHARKFNAGGEKEVSVVVSDGKLEAKKTWKVKVM